MKVLVVGGSNTAMRPGYVGDLSDALKRQLGDNGFQLHSVALGANACTMGLELLQGVDLKNYDVVCIEYFINDTLLLGQEQNRSTWLAAYLGLHRLIHAHNPNAKIANIILCRRVLRGSEHAMREDIYCIAKDFDAQVIDVDAELRANLSEVEFSELYSNNSHYAVGAPTVRVASIIAESLLSGNGQVRGDYPKISDGVLSFENARVLSMHTLNAEGARRFENSRYLIRCAPVRVGNPLVVDVPGSLISISFVSAPASGSVLIQEEGEDPVLVNTAHKEVVSGKWKFLVQSVILKNKNWYGERADLATTRRVRFDLITEELGAKYVNYLQPSSLLASTLAPTEQEAQLIGCMYYGDVGSADFDDDTGLKFVSGKVYQYE